MCRADRSGGGAPSSGRAAPDPGLNALEKLPPVVAESEMVASNLHRAIMLLMCVQVNSGDT